MTFAAATHRPQRGHGDQTWLTIGAIVVIVAIRLAASLAVRAIGHRHTHERAVFWTNQGASLASLVFVAIACLAICVDDTKITRAISGEFTAAAIQVASTAMEVTVKGPS